MSKPSAAMDGGGNKKPLTFGDRGCPVAGKGCLQDHPGALYRLTRFRHRSVYLTETGPVIPSVLVKNSFFLLLINSGLQVYTKYRLFLGGGISGV